jgi:hypothetical protein
MVTKGLTHTAPSGGIDRRPQTGDVRHEANAKRDGTNGPGSGGGIKPRMGRGSASLDEEQQGDDENQNAGGQVPKRRSP